MLISIIPDHDHHELFKLRISSVKNIWLFIILNFLVLFALFFIKLAKLVANSLFDFFFHIYWFWPFYHKASFCFHVELFVDIWL